LSHQIFFQKNEGIFLGVGGLAVFFHSYQKKAKAKILKKKAQYAQDILFTYSTNKLIIRFPVRSDFIS
jgi:hypothetical protein